MKKSHTNFILLLFCWSSLALFSCNSHSNADRLQVQVDSLKKEIGQMYKPGLGEFMMGIQVHHAKIWFAGKNQNWALANFEVGEIKETLDAVKKYCTDRPEIKSLPILYPALDSVNNAIKAKSLQRFEKSFALLTSSCNSCHKNTHREFNVIKVPETPPFTNQDFKEK